MGHYSYVARGAQLNSCDIGSYSSIGSEVMVGGLGHHPTGFFSTSPVTYSPGNSISRVLGCSGYQLDFEESGRVTIGNDVWIGARCIIVDGVNIGTGAIIGANTVVTKDVPPYGVYYGSPPKLHRFRFSEPIIKEFLNSEWWTGDVAEIETERMLEIMG